MAENPKHDADEGVIHGSNPEVQTNYEILLEEQKEIVNRQIEEIRSQRKQALRILRGQFAVAGIIVAAITTVIASSVQIPIPLEFTRSRIIGPPLVMFGALLMGRGIIGFFRGIYAALAVLSNRSFSNIPWIDTLRLIWRGFVLGKELEDEQRTPDLGIAPSSFESILEESDSTGEEELVRHNIDCIKQNEELIQQNYEYLNRLYQKIAWGISGFAIGLLVFQVGVDLFA